MGAEYGRSVDFFPPSHQQSGEKSRYGLIGRNLHQLPFMGKVWSDGMVYPPTSTQKGSEGTNNYKWALYSRKGGQEITPPIRGSSAATFKASKPLVEVALWLLVLCSGINAAFGSANNGTKGVVLCNERERQALLKFKHALNASEYALTSWVGENCCRWEGVGCNNETGYVIDLNLKGIIYTVSGEIDPSLLELEHLSYLDLSGNQFGQKSIPKFFGSFLKLRHLDLSFAAFRGIFPWQIGNISGLRYLDLSGNYLQIENLQWLSHLSSLKYLDLGNADLKMVSDWVQPINMIPSLSVLRLSQCGLRNSSTPLHLNLTSLTVLDLSYNSLTLKPLDWLSQLLNLVSLDLSNNRLKGPILSSLWGHCNLLKLDLSSNNFNGDLNGFLKCLFRCGEKHGRLASIRELYLSNNNFSGTVPKSLGQLSNLVSLKMSNNSLEGAISEAHFANLTRLEELELFANSLVFNVSPHWIPPFQLQHIGLSSCQLGPQFPSWLQFQRNFSYLDLSHSQISDVIPNWFWNLLSQVSYLNISHNLIRGEIPSALNFGFVAVVDFNSNRFVGPLPQNLSWVILLDLSNNFLSGPIDTSFGDIMEFLFLSNNSLHDSIPSSICNYNFISFLDLSRNNLIGQVPSCFEDFQGLNVLDLSYNNLDGMIPNIFTFPNLNWLQLSHNNLSGVLPSSIGVQSSLLALDLSGNRLSGSIPRWLGENTSDLVILNLRSNMFHGNIPPQLSLLSSLQILDLANNRLSGEIPTSFGNFTSMAKTRKLIRSIFGASFLASEYETIVTYSEYVTVIMKGIEMKYTKALSLVTTMDLSRNNLSGEIPQELTSLHGLQSLNLSGNHLEGKIPKNIGSLMQLESLDLSQNHLSGKIPSSISSLTFLSKLNLSNNNLSGTIPSGNQLQTLLDPSIYAGNYDLCGPPLTKLCSAEVVPPPPNTFNGEDEKDDTEHWWFYVALALGFVAGFWLICDGSDGDEENKGVVFHRDAPHRDGVSVVEFEEEDLKPNLNILSTEMGSLCL
ncbi:putative leucine-rich repeat receptor-like protein kinase [Cinnamomum micranthum f. kanehirae]|uniref:Putative leucine-rich repeat receptor-like protein kinase n=1 Tax=Cinnamomum micranthum f. kanehirae TaxID=337451 RepID=A0A443PSR0_9MAGN|nr:putative leucine-rich repeat receptor-like protein kinase [Cinnamomum micranthum f. kanehirae]